MQFFEAFSVSLCWEFRGGNGGKEPGKHKTKGKVIMIIHLRL